MKSLADRVVDAMWAKFPKARPETLEVLRKIVEEEENRSKPVKGGRITSDNLFDGHVPIPRKRNELLDALLEACGRNPEETTKTAFRAAAVALADIKSVCPNLNRDELFARAQKYKSKHPDWPLTPASLCKHWSECGGGGRTNAARHDIYMEPPRWRAVLQDLYQLSDEAIRDKEWLDLGPDTRREILSRISA